MNSMLSRLPPLDQPTPRQRHVWAACLLLAYTLIVGYAISHHAMWRDETQAWLIARDTPTIGALLDELRYESHPALWYLLLKLLTALTSNPVSMQVLNFGLALAAVAMILWLAPFSLLERGMLAFGYFTLFEYGVKSRSYMLACVLLFAFCAGWRRLSPIVIAFVLALLANVHFLFLIVSIGAALAVVIERAGRGEGMQSGDSSATKWLVAAAVLGLGWLAAVLTVLPHADAAFHDTWRLDFFPMALARYFEDIFLGLSRSLAGATCLVALAALLLFRTSPSSIKLFLAASLGGLVSFFYVKSIGAPWHQGVLFFSFVAALWMDRSLKPSSVNKSLTRADLTVQALFVLALIGQIVASVSAVRMDLARPASSGRDLARFIKAKGWASDPVLGAPDYSVSTIVAYLGIRSAYYANGRRWGSFAIWDKIGAEPANMRAFLEDSDCFGDRATLIVSQSLPFDPELAKAHRFTAVATFSGAAVPDENFVVYRRAE